jgi:predicted DNA-binding protein with PD1-like motif
MLPANTVPMTRRCFFAAAGLSVATGAAGAGESVRARDDLPKSALVSDGSTKTYLLVFHTGQKVTNGLAAFARAQRIEAGHVTGIGALSDWVLGYFDPQKKTYLRHHEEGQAELLSLTGNVALYDNEPFFHVHVALGMKNGDGRGGHLFEATVRPTVELYLTTYSRPIQRKIDPEWAIPLLDP